MCKSPTKYCTGPISVNAHPSLLKCYDIVNKGIKHAITNAYVDLIRLQHVKSGCMKCFHLASFSSMYRSETGSNGSVDRCPPLEG